MLSENANKNLRSQRAAGMVNPLTELEIFDLANSTYPTIQQHMTYHILCFLLDSPEFDLKTYQHKKDDRLKAPAPVNQLPCGPEHTTLQYLLGTVGIAEVSYEDNSRLINEWFNQLGWDTIAKCIKVSVEKIVAWVGDQLTMDRLRCLFKYCAEDLNSFQQLDFSLFVFGWLHLQMAFANSLHKQYLGMTQGCGLRQGFLLLEKKGLTKVQTKGPFHHDLEETLYHIAEGHIREDWLILAGVEKLEEL